MAIENMKDREFHDKELGNAAKYNPYDDEDEYKKPDPNVNRLIEDETDDDEPYVGGFRT